MIEKDSQTGAEQTSTPAASTAPAQPVGQPLQEEPKKVEEDPDDDGGRGVPAIPEPK